MQMLPKDTTYSFLDVITTVKHRAPQYMPGKKALYSNTNEQILCNMIEHICELPFADVIDTVVLKPLGLNDTYIYEGTEQVRKHDTTTILYQGELHDFFSIIACERAAGGMISSTKDMISFMKAFFGEDLFDANDKEEIYDWNTMSLGTYYGIGILRCKVHGLELWGHISYNGVCRWYLPKLDLYLVGAIHEMKPKKVMSYVSRLIRCFL